MLSSSIVLPASFLAGNHILDASPPEAVTIDLSLAFVVWMATGAQVRRLLRRRI